MGAKTGTGSNGTANATGKSGNNVKEARGASYEHRQGNSPVDKNEQHQGKHPPNKIYTGPKEMHPEREVSRGNRQSDKG